VTPNSDGTGYTVQPAYAGHSVHLDIGNVSIVFDDRNIWAAPGNEVYSSVVLQFAEYRDDPVRLCNAPMAVNPGETGCAERIMRALAIDLGFTVKRDSEEG
jgi:hypothetical protein